MAYFSFNDAPNVCFMWKIWTAGRSVQHPDSSTMKPSCCNSCSMWFCIVLLKYTHLEGSICCSKTFIYLSAFIVPSKTCKLPIPYAIMHPIYQRCWLLNWSLITRWKVSLLFSPEDTASLISDKNVQFGLILPWNTFAKPLQFDVWERFLKYSTIFLRILSQIGEPLPIFYFWQTLPL